MPQAVEVIQGGQTRTVEFPDEMSRAEIEAALRQQFPMPDMRQSTMGEELTRGVERLKTDYLTAYNSFGNPEQAALEALRRNQELAQELGLPPSLAETAEIFATQGIPEGVLNALGDVPRGIAQQAPMTGTILGASTAAAAVTPPTLPFVGPMAKPVAGALAGYGATLGPLYSQNLQRQAEADLEAGRPVDVSPAKAAGAAAVQGVAELIGAYMVGGTTLVSKALGLAPSQIGQRSSSALVNVAKDALRGVKRGAAGEIPTEFAQQVIERAQADLDLFSDEALAEYGEAAYMAGIAGGGLGGITGAVSPAIAPSPIEDLPGDLPTTADLSEITQETITPDLADIEPTPDISAETLRAQTEEKLALIAPKLRGVLKGRGLDDIGISLSYELDPEALARTDDPDDVEALFDPTARSILLAADRIQGFEQMDASQLQSQFAGLVDHEMVHGAKHFGLWTDAEWTVLENAARRRTNSNGQTYMDAAKSSYTKASPEIQREEAVAELVRDTFAGRTGLAGQPLNLMQRLIEFFRKMGNALTGTGYASFNQVINDIDSGVLGARPRGGTPATPVATPMIVGSPALASRYRGEHTAPVRYERNTLDDLSDIYPDDVYSAQGARYYGSGPDATRMDQKTIEIMRKAYRNPEAEVTIYRAVPEGIEDINPGDWVSLTPEYADSHGSSWVGEDYHVLEKRVKANDVVTNGDSLQEWGYAPADQTPLASRRLKSDAQAQQQLPLPEGMTGAEVAAEESRLAEQEQMRERNRAGVAEARRILEDDQQPLASRRQKTAQGLRALGDVPRPPRDAGWEQRAREQGFDTGRVLYHYTDKFEFGGREFEQFIPSAAGRLGPGVYTSPDADYAERHILRGPSTGGARAIPVFARGRIANEEDYQQALELAIDDYRTRTTDAVNAYTVKKLAKEILEEQGFSGIERQDNKGKEVVIFDPKNLRSIHANFDPAWTESTTLLASRGRLDRAKEQGFDTENILYHGTASDIKEFDPSKFGDTTKANSARLGAWLVSDPEVASGYARYAAEEAPVQKLIEESDAAGRAGNFDLQEQLTIQAEDLDLGRSLVDAGGQNVVPLVVRGSLFEVDAEGQTLGDLDDGQLVTWAQEAKNNGFDGLKIKNFSDNIDWGNYVSADHYLIFDPENIRSVNAQFDPAQTESPKLLASRARLPHGLPESLTVDGSGRKPEYKVVQNFTPSNRSTVTANITKVLENNPEALATYNAWVSAEEDAFGGEKVPVPPHQAIAYAANPELLADKLNQLTPDLKATVDEGFGYVNDIKNIYESGTASPELTGRLFLWGILSRGAGPVQQETAFLNILNEATPFIEKSASGNMTQNDVDSWLEIASGILPEGSPARSVTMNVNAAGKLLFELGKKAEGSDSSVLSVLHDSLSNPNQTAAEFRRKFFALTDKPGIDNKVVSFISLVAGKPDVLVMDRIQSRHLWDDGSFGGANIYDGLKVEGRPQGTGLNEILTGPRGLLITELLEKGLKDSVVQAYEIIGRPQDASLGRMHWETWVIEGNQGVPHSTLQAVKSGSPIGYSVTEGKKGTYSSGATYRQTENGLVVEYPLSDGTLARMTPAQFVAFKKYISKPANKIVPQKFKVSESTVKPWYESQGVDRGALDDAARRYENTNADGTIRSSYDESIEAGDSLASRERTRRRGRGTLKTKPEDSAALAEDKSKGATEVRGNPEADRAAADEVRKVKTLASRRKPSDIVESTAYNRVADVASTRASRGQGNINNALPFEAPSSADDHSIVFQMQDKLIDLKNTEKAIKDNQRKHGLTLLKDSESPYLGEESMHGIIGNKFNRFEKDEVRPLVDKLTRRNITRQELEEFLVLRHAIERNAHVRKLNAASKEPRADLQDGGAGSLNGQRLLDDYVKQQMRSQYGMTWNDSTKSWEGGNRKAAIMNDLANDFDAITRGTLKELKDSGLINQDSLDKLQGYYKYYAPLRGLAPDEDVAVEEHARISRRANNLSIKGVETEIAKGRVSEASPPLGQIIFQRQNAIKRGTVNDVVGQRMLNLIRENPNEDYWKIHTDRKYADVVGKELLGVKEDGKQYFIELKDPRLRQAMMSLDAGQMNKALSLMRGVNRYLSAVMTSYNPSFIAPNFTRDITTAISNLVGEQNAVDGKALNTDGLIGAVIRDVGPSVREVYRGLRGKNLNKKLAQDWKDYMESGAKTEWFHVRSPEESTRDIDDLIAMSKGTFKGNMKAGKDAIAGWVSDINGAIENGVRFATFKNARDAFIKNGDSRKEALAKAASLAKNLTVNFNRKGNSGEQLNALYLFFNASVQGTANFLRNLNSPAKRRLLGSMVSFGALTAWLNEMVSEEDDDGRTYYANLEPYVKERNLVIMKTINPFYDGHPKGVYTIPLPYGYNTLHVLGVNTVEAAMGLISPQDAAARVASTALGSFSPVGFGTSENPGKWVAKGITPQIGKPLMEIVLNEDFFGSPVYTTPFEFGPQIPVANLSQRSTPEAFKQTTQFLNRLPLLGPGTGGDESKSGPLGWISPDALHHYFASMIGGTGMFAERTGRLVGESADYFQETDGPISLDDFFERQGLTVNDIPILRRFNHESRGFIAQSRYYDRKEDIMAADRQVDILRGAERGEYIRENRPLLQMKRTIDNSDKRLRNINRRLARIGEQILNATSLESTIRLEEEQHRLEEIKRGVYNRFNKLFDERVGRTE